MNFFSLVLHRVALGVIMGSSYYDVGYSCQRDESFIEHHLAPVQYS